MKFLPTCVLSLLFTFFTSTAFAQFNVVGNADNVSSSAKPNSYRLTSTAKGEKSGVWSTNKLDIKKNSFVLTFSAHFGKKNGKGSDGIALVFQNDSRGTKAIGNSTTGKLMGFDAIQPSMAIEFDTYDDGTTAGDIAADHIAITKNGSDKLTDQVSKAVAAKATGATIEDNADHNVQVEWNANSKTLDVYFDGLLRKSYTSDIVSEIFKGDANVFWGFTSSTGKNGNKHQVSTVNMKVTAAAAETSLGPLPVKLVSFKAAATSAGMKLAWATATELNSSYFAVERSTDAKTWTALTQVSFQGNSNVQNNYSFTDAAAPAGLTYYRLKMVDFDGTFEYSGVVSVRSSGIQAAGINVYPNPVQPAELLNVRFTGSAAFTQISILDMAGNVVSTETQASQIGENTLQVSTVALKPGMYVLQLVNGDSRETSRIMVR
jgi:hypothetical protein